WTIPSNLAIALNEKFEYSVVEADGTKYVVATELVDQLKEEFEWTNVSEVKRVKGSELEYVTAQHPIYDRESLVILGDHVTLD
ncbi:class I tRNA ligase family protein, partial [Staphylococcus sp. SIMBA_130]